MTVSIRVFPNYILDGMMIPTASYMVVRAILASMKSHSYDAPFSIFFIPWNGSVPVEPSEGMNIHLPVTFWAKRRGSPGYEDKSNHTHFTDSKLRPSLMMFKQANDV
jgi:hypothetical protein